MKLLKVCALVVVVLLVGVSPAMAQGSSFTLSGASIGAGLGMGLAIIGAGWGLGRIGSAAVESMARQPEVAGKVQTGMIIVAAMLEGATLACVIFSYLVSLNSGANSP